jgi:HAD superfamily hydrolase (TIGR01509 family)
MPPRAILFDFDGVLADTENIHIAAWERTFAAMGWSVPPELCAQAVEVDDARFLREVLLARGITQGDIEGWVGRKQRMTASLLADSPRLFPGVAELVERLRGRARLAIVSTTCRENIDAVLGATGLAEAFEVIVGKQDVPQVKPNPAAYRLALRRLGVTARQALALEDSATGLRSALAAGIRCMIVAHRGERAEWVGSHRYLAGFSDPTAVLGALGFSENPV